MANTNLAALNEEKALMDQAFDLVKPDTHWKDPIDAVVSKSALVAFGLTIEQVCKSVEFFTATEATAVPVGRNGYHVTAAGYRAGPAA